MSSSSYCASVHRVRVGARALGASSRRGPPSSRDLRRRTDDRDHVTFGASERALHRGEVHAVPTCRVGRTQAIGLLARTRSCRARLTRTGCNATLGDWFPLRRARPLKGGPVAFVYTVWVRCGTDVPRTAGEEDACSSGDNRGAKDSPGHPGPAHPNRAFGKEVGGRPGPGPDAYPRRCCSCLRGLRIFERPSLVRAENKRNIRGVPGSQSQRMGRVGDRLSQCGRLGSRAQHAKEAACKALAVYQADREAHRRVSQFERSPRRWGSAGGGLTNDTE